MLRELSRLAPTETRRLRLLLAGLVVEAVLAGLALSVTVPFLRSLLSGSTMAAWRWLLLLAALFVLYAAVRFGLRQFGYTVGVAIGRALWQRLGAHLEKMPVGWFAPHRIGEVGRASSQGIIDVMVLPAHLFHPIVSAVVTPSTLVVLMFWIDARLALALLLTAPAMVWLHRGLQKRLTTTDVEAAKAAIEVENRVAEFASAQPALRMLSHQCSLMPLQIAFDTRKATAHAQLTRIAPSFVGLSLVFQATFVLLLVLGVSLFLRNSVDVVSLIAIFFLLVRMIEPLTDAADLSGQIQVARNSMKALTEILDVAALSEPERPVSAAGTDLNFDNVGFDQGDAPILRDVSLLCPQNSLTALVGPSGAGKSTLLALASRLWDVDRGAIRIGGVDVRDLGSWRTQQLVSVVLQDVTLPEGTIRQAICAGQSGIEPAIFETALERSGVREVLRSKPAGLETLTGFGGTALSQGQRQRIALARALVKMSPIMMLDEPTSALDGANLRKMRQTMQCLAQDHTVIVATHDMSIAAAADQVCFLCKGRVEEIGTHDELIIRNGPYAKFCKEFQHQGSASSPAG